MDLKDPKTQKIIMGALAFFIVIYFWHSRLYSKYDHQIETKSRDFERITTDLRRVELKAKSLDALKVEYTDLIRRYEEIESLLPEVKQIPSFLVQLHTASSLTGTRITDIEPLPLTTEEFYNIASFRLNVTGTYHDFGSFIGYVANFPFIANITSLDVTAVETARADQDGDGFGVHKRETISAEFVLSTYFVKENERLQPLEI